MLQMESEQGQTEQRDTVILSDQTTVQKGINMYNIFMYKKSYFTHRYEKKSYISDKR